VRTRPTIKPSQKVRILERDNHTCVVCHRDDVPLHVGHLLSVEDGRKVGATDDELFSDENLCAMCAECNLGMSSRTISLRLVAKILRARLRWRDEAEEAQGEAG
jgi:5-methylcytosine-specific restriction endonuclease McrA